MLGVRNYYRKCATFVNDIGALDVQKEVNFGCAVYEYAFARRFSIKQYLTRMTEEVKSIYRPPTGTNVLAVKFFTHQFKSS